MGVPEEIRAIPRPKNTVVYLSIDGRYLVVKKSSRRVAGKKNAQPYSLGTIGEIVDGQYKEIRKEPIRTIDDVKNKNRGVNRRVSLKDYAHVQLAYNLSQDLYSDLLASFKIDDAKKMYCIALLRSIDIDIRDRDIEFIYSTSYLSELMPHVALSKNTISSSLKGIGMEYHLIKDFLTNRAKKFEGYTQVIDGTLIDNNGTVNSFSEFSRKGRIKGTTEESILYSYDLKTKEPVTIKLYSGNVTDARSIKDFIISFHVENGLLIMDKGFGGANNIELFKSIEGLSYIIPLKKDAKLIKDNKAYDDLLTPIKYQDKLLFSKASKLKDNTYLYSFKDTYLALEEEKAFIERRMKDGTYNKEEYEKEKDKFGVIVFHSNKELSLLEVYEAYASRWEIETMFKMMKDILDLDTSNVHSDYSNITTQFINFLSVIIATKMKNKFKETILYKKKNKEGKIVEKTIADEYSYRQIIRYLSKVKKIKEKDGTWETNYPANCKYVEELCLALGV